MKTKKYFIVSFLALLAAGCQDDDMGGGTAAQPGDEVTFSVSLGENAATRTVYGTETSDGYPINWVSGDQVIIASPECKAEEGGNPMATYNVTPDGTDATIGTLAKAESDGIGVRWGTSSSATFYSVYPASATFDNNYSTVTLNMPTEQTVTRNNTAYTYDMNACFMYAKTTATSGDMVGLTYVPISTALRFTLKGPSFGTISSITFTAPEGTYIAGEFEAKLGEVSGNTSSTSTPVPELTASGSNSQSITIYVKDGNSDLTLNNGDSFEVNVFFLLENDVAEATSGWAITVNTSLGLSYTKSLSGVTLTKGKIHDLGDFPAFASGNEGDGYYIVNTGSTTTYLVSNDDGLLAWNKAANEDLTAETNCILLDDINLSSNWTPVGSNISQYIGKFDGGGHTISGLEISAGRAGGHLGLIGHLGSGGVVQNLTLKDVSITSNYGYGNDTCVGAVVGCNRGTVENCHVSGTITAVVTTTGISSDIGGVVGGNTGGTMIACSSACTVTGTNYIGGVTGENTGIVIACYSTGNVSSTSSYVGGVTGRNWYGTVTACYHATGTISGGSNYVGGVTGRNWYGTVTACYWSSSNVSYGIGGSGSSGDNTNATQVTGTWTSDIVTTMNNAIDTSYGWQYVYNSGSPPALTTR